MYNWSVIILHKSAWELQDILREAHFFMLHKLDNHDLFSGVGNRHPLWGPPVYVGTCDFTNLALTRDKNIAGSKFVHERRG